MGAEDRQRGAANRRADRPQGTAPRKGGGPQGGSKRPAVEAVRAQLNLAAETWKRLGVHSAMCGRDKSRLADDILLAYLRRHGKMRDALDAEFGVEGPQESGTGFSEEAPAA